MPVGVGPDLSETEVCGPCCLVRANTLAFGHSGVRPQVINLLLDMLNAGVLPRIPSQGSLGASGDLAPLAHLTLVLIGEGQANYARPPAARRRKRCAGRDLARVELQAKEGWPCSTARH